MKKLLITTTAIIMMTTKMTAQEIPDAVKPYLTEFQKLVKIPDKYHFHSVKKVLADDIPAYLFRYEKDENKGLRREHFSFIISEKKQLLGFTYMDKRYANFKMLSKIETEKIARNFLLKTDKSLANDIENLWIERHDEQIVINNSEVLIIAGMKYKCYRSAKDDYAWVIVGFDGSIITFERNIKWNNDEHRRITEKWLHDSFHTR